MMQHADSRAELKHISITELIYTVFVSRPVQIDTVKVCLML